MDLDILLISLMFVQLLEIFEMMNKELVQVLVIFLLKHLLTQQLVKKNGWIYNETFFADSATEYDYFGRSVSIWYDFAIIGMDGDDNSTGSAYML